MAEGLLSTLEDVGLTEPMQIIQPETEQHWREARRLIEEYAAALGVDLCFQNFDHEIEHLRDEYGAPKGALFLATDDEMYVGCVGVREFTAGVGEMKRLYAVPATRGRGVGRLLAEHAIAAAKTVGYRSLVLDTLPSMTEAQGLYKSLGFAPTSAYRHNPVSGTTFLALDL